MAARSSRHVVQLYGEQDQLLAGSVTRYLAEGLDRAEGIVAIAAAEHLHAFARGLRHHSGYQTAVRGGSLVLLDARVLLARILVDGQPAWDRFEGGVGSVLREVLARAGGAPVRAYGEMVGLLWADGQPSAAIRLEEHWNRLQTTLDFDLYCAYPIDALSEDLPADVMDPILSAHTRLIPGGGELASALARAMDHAPGAEPEALNLHTGEAETPLVRARPYQHLP